MPANYLGFLRYLVGTMALSTLIAAALTAFGTHRHGFGVNLIYSQCIGILTYASIDLPRRQLWPAGAPSLLPMLGLVLLAAPVGWFGGSYIASGILNEPWGPTALGFDTVLGFLTLTASAGLLGTYVFWTRERIASSERGEAEARLKLLQAQIEPHFLFNTLANLQALIAIDPSRAQTMLGHLDTYLRATLARTRSEQGTLAQEFALLRGYLEIISIRMGSRLTWSLDLPDAIANATLPPMLLQPLVENAIQHGLEPKVDGGSVLVTAREEAGKLILKVEDSGRGMRATATQGTGLGLASVRARLAAIYAGKATLEIEAPAGCGTRITLRLPRLPPLSPLPSAK